MTATELKIAYIGGGSRDWARKLMFDLARCPDLGGRMALYDIDKDSARLNEQLGNWLQAQPGVVSRWKYETASNLDEALRDADFVVISIQPGPLELMAEEIALAEEYRDVLPGRRYHRRAGIEPRPAVRRDLCGVCRTIGKICPQAWVINYTNPMSLCTRTLEKVAPALKVFGCCHEVFSTQKMLAELVGRVLGGLPRAGPRARFTAM